MLTQLYKSAESLRLKPSIAADITEALGKVPTVQLNRIHNICHRHQLALKLESCNPGGSIKEKNAAYLILRAEKDGFLGDGGTIVESSSGNFGIGLAMVGAARGYRVLIVVDAKTAPPMRRMLLAYGAELVDVPLSEADANGSMQVARMNKAAELARSIDGAWYPCQHRNPLNPMAHFETTALEIEEAYAGAPDVIVVGVSTVGQLGGIAKFCRGRYPATKIVGVDVEGSVIFGTPPSPYKMTGLGLSFVPPNYHPSMVDEAFVVRDDLAFTLCHLLARKEGLLLGASTGAIVAAGLSYAMRSGSEDQKILMINPDRGDRYLETVYNHDWIKAQHIELLSGDVLDTRLEDLKPLPVSVLRSVT